MKLFPVGVLDIEKDDVASNGGDADFDNLSAFTLDPTEMNSRLTAIANNTNKTIRRLTRVVASGESATGSEAVRFVLTDVGTSTSTADLGRAGQQACQPQTNSDYVYIGASCLLWATPENITVQEGQYSIASRIPPGWGQSFGTKSVACFCVVFMSRLKMRGPREQEGWLGPRGGKSFVHSGRNNLT